MVLLCVKNLKIYFWQHGMKIRKYRNKGKQRYDIPKIRNQQTEKVGQCMAIVNLKFFRGFLPFLLLFPPIILTTTINIVERGLKHP